MELLTSGRACLMGIAVGMLFLAWYATRIYRIALRDQVVVLAVVGLLFFCGVWIYGDRNAVLSIFSPVQLMERYSYYQKRVREERKVFVAVPIKIQVFNRDLAVVDQGDDEVELSVENGELKEEVLQRPVVQEVAPRGVVSEVVVPEVIVLESDPEPVSTKKTFRDRDVADANSVFRLFVWKDMLKELWRHRPLMGFSFGRPQRSPSIEILHWAESEWSRDGWITPHNTFLHYIYRGGIVGVAVIGVILVSIVVLVGDFLAARSWQGAFLVSGLIYWIVITQFGVILELPYNAVPFWCLFGLAWAYRNRFKEMKG